MEDLRASSASDERLPETTLVDRPTPTTAALIGIVAHSLPAQDSNATLGGGVAAAFATIRFGLAVLCALSKASRDRCDCARLGSRATPSRPLLDCSIAHV